MANTFIYCGLGIMLLGALFGFFVAVKGYRHTDWSKVKKISYWGKFQRGKLTPQMKRLIWIWAGVMILGFALTGVGISLGIE